MFLSTGPVSYLAFLMNYVMAPTVQFKSHEAGPGTNCLDGSIAVSVLLSRTLWQEQEIELSQTVGFDQPMLTTASRHQSRTCQHLLPQIIHHLRIDLLGLFLSPAGHFSYYKLYITQVLMQRCCLTDNNYNI